MARLNVNPTRMALSGLKKSLDTAVKGHRLLKDKRDELMRQFLNTVREAKKLRQDLDNEILKSQMHLQAAAAVMGEKGLKTALLLHSSDLHIALKKKNVMSVILPQFEVEEMADADVLAFGFAMTSSDFESAVKILSRIRKDLIHLAELEKAIELMAGEIERTRRRVNALEYVIIPNYQETIRYIRMKLDENERANSIRLLKVKDMVIENNIKI